MSLVLKNLSLQDSGIYRCELDGGQDNKEFTFEVYESGMFPGFNANLTMDHSACCAAQNMSAKCQPLCTPGEMETHTFDLMECDTEIGKFLHCVTEGGNISHAHCCRLSLVPPFCWDFCTGSLSRLREAHHLCLYWLPEIIQCYEHAYLPLPEPPGSVMVETMGSEKLKICWEPAETPEGVPVKQYTVNYKEIPRLPFLGGGLSNSLSRGSSSMGGSIFGSRGLSSSPIDSAVEMEDPPSDLSVRQPRSYKFDERLGDMLSDEDFGDVGDKVDTGDSEVEGRLVFRQKRGTWVFVAHNGQSNMTRVKEFKFVRVNTTDTCYTATGLSAATQYIVFVTATNEYGTSLPSVRTIVSTPAVVLPNGTLPNIADCCRTSGVADVCIPKLCDLSRTPSPFGALDIALNCRGEFTGVAPCLADGRDHTPCCRSRGVQGDCLKLCDGSATYLGLNSVLCLTMDMQAVYTCLRQGYGTHPSPPQNTTVTEVGSDYAIFSWSEPVSNAENVENFSLFYRKEEDFVQGFTEIKDVKSPYTLFNLSPGESYLVYVVAHGKKGSSLQSSVEEFFTVDTDISNLCPDPLLTSEGKPYYCGPTIPCPKNYQCTKTGEEDGLISHCCPTGGEFRQNSKVKIRKLIDGDLRKKMFQSEYGSCASMYKCMVVRVLNTN